MFDVPKRIAETSDLAVCFGQLIGEESGGVISIIGAQRGLGPPI